MSSMSRYESIEVLIEIMNLLRRQRDIWDRHPSATMETRVFNRAYYQRRIDALGVALLELGAESPGFSGGVSQAIVVD